MKRALMEELLILKFKDRNIKEEINLVFGDL